MRVCLLIFTWVTGEHAVALPFLPEGGTHRPLCPVDPVGMACWDDSSDSHSWGRNPSGHITFNALSPNTHTATSTKKVNSFQHLLLFLHSFPLGTFSPSFLESQTFHLPSTGCEFGLSFCASFPHLWNREISNTQDIN